MKFPRAIGLDPTAVEGMVVVTVLLAVFMTDTVLDI